MVHIIAILVSAALLVGLAAFIQHMLRDNWADMSAALMGRPMPTRVATQAAKATVVTARSQRQHVAV